MEPEYIEEVPEPKQTYRTNKNADPEPAVIKKPEIKMKEIKVYPPKKKSTKKALLTSMDQPSNR